MTDILFNIFQEGFLSVEMSLEVQCAIVGWDGTISEKRIVARASVIPRFHLSSVESFPKKSFFQGITIVEISSPYDSVALVVTEQ
jgi:hypothetical protein